MTLRIGIDVDGVLADFDSAFRQVEHGMFGTSQTPQASTCDDEDESVAPSATLREATKNAGESATRQAAVWRRIRATADFWTTLRPCDAESIRRLHGMMLRHRWEVVFITQRPQTAGDTAQRQTQRWLTRHGFDMPSVLVIAGSRGAAANALRLTYHVDDSPRNCVDVKSESTARPILLVRPGETLKAKQAKALGIGVAMSIGECLDILEQASAVRDEKSALDRLAALVGWR